MKKVLLVHNDKENIILHYRVKVYSYLSRFLKKRGWGLSVICSKKDDEFCDFNYHLADITLKNVIQYVLKNDISTVILFINMKRWRLFPLIITLRLLGKKVIYWGHGKNLQDESNIAKNFLYKIAFFLSSSILLYNKISIKKYIPTFWHKKSYYANNSIDLSDACCLRKPSAVLKELNFENSFNICVIGRIQERKKIPTLCDAVRKLKHKNVTLTIIGNIEDQSVLQYKEDTNIALLGPIVGAEKYDYLNACSLYCLPGTVGLSIVDALCFGKPFIAIDDGVIKHSPEVIYLKDGKNGFLLNELNVEALVEKISCYINDPSLIERHSSESLNIYRNEANIDKMAEGFLKALNHV